MELFNKPTFFVISSVVLVIVVAIFMATHYFSREREAVPVTPSTSNSQDSSAMSTVPRVIVSGLKAPWSIAFLNDGTPLISSRNNGEILEILSDGTTRVVGKVDGAVHRGEGGLMGIVIDDQSRLYTYFTTNTDNRIVRYPLTGAPGSLALAAPEIILEGLASASTHNGGRIAFGPDGMLYATVGDAADIRHSQNLDSLNGKILRMTKDGEVPSDNPFPNSLVYSYGHRNPQGLAWTEDGTMYSAEFGQNKWDELNTITAGSNYGWPIVEGIATTEGYVDPVQQWVPREASPSGMTHYQGMIYIANLRGKVLRTVPVNNPSTHTDLYSNEYGRLRDVAVSPRGDIWFITNNTDGRGNPSATDDRIMSISFGSEN